MTEERRIRLKELVHQRFKDISRREALLAYADGFPFGIEDLSPEPEERLLAESEARDTLEAKLVAKGK